MSCDVTTSVLVLASTPASTPASSSPMPTAAPAEHAATLEKNQAVATSLAAVPTHPPGPPSLPSASSHAPYCALSPARRRYILGLVATAGLFGPLAGGIYLPALPVLAAQFHVGTTAINATVTVFMAVFAVGPLAWAGWADWRGRRPLYAASLLIYITSNVLLSALPAHFAALVVLRIVQAFGSSAVVSLGAGTVADITEPKRRATAMSVFLVGPQCGPILGPVIGGALAGQSSWRWIFGFLAIGASVLLAAIVLTLPETLRCRVGNGSLHARKKDTATNTTANGFIVLGWPPRLTSPLAPPGKRGPPPPKPTLRGYWRLFSYPPIGIVSANTAVLYATYFSIAVDLPDRLGTAPYHWSTAAVGASYLAVGLAMVVGSAAGGRLSDWRRARVLAAVLEARREDALTADTATNVDNVLPPENRLIDQIWGVLVCAAGCLMYGWFVAKHLHPAVVLVATFLTGFGMSWVFVATTAFLTECVPQQAAGAFALGNMLRNPAAAVAAVLMPTLTSHMGVGWCFTGWALLDLVLVGSAIIILRIRGPYWRKQRNAKLAAAKLRSVGR